MVIDFEIVDVFDVILVLVLCGDIWFENVSFGYDECLILCGIDLDIKVGEIVVFVGLFGVGKMMLLVLLLCFYELILGWIIVDGMVLD